ncbi:hypothetical protein D9M69_641490 [compost metagenome]
MSAANASCASSAPSCAFAVAWLMADCTGDSKCSVQPGDSTMGSVVCKRGAPAGIWGRAVSGRTSWPVLTACSGGCRGSGWKRASPNCRLVRSVWARAGVSGASTSKRQAATLPSRTTPCWSVTKMGALD